MSSFNQRLETYGFVRFSVDPQLSPIMEPFQFCLWHHELMFIPLMLCIHKVATLYENGLRRVDFRTAEGSCVNPTDTPLMLGLCNGETITMTFTIRM
jgi:hypothetical protein